MLLIFAFAYSSHIFFSTKQAQVFSKSIDKKLHLNVLTELAKKQKLFQSTTPGLPINPLPCFSSFKILYKDSRENTFWKRKVLHYLHPLVDQHYFVMHFHFPSTPSSPTPVIWKRQPVFQPNTHKSLQLSCSPAILDCTWSKNSQKESLLHCRKEVYWSTIMTEIKWKWLWQQQLQFPVFTHFLAYMLKATKHSFM